MEQTTIHPTQQLANVPWQIPSSKSWTIRYCLTPLITGKALTITNPLYSPDLDYLLESLEKLGCRITKSPLTIHPPQKIQSSTLFLGNSGLALRLLLGILATDTSKHILDGDASLRKRPLHPLVVALKKMGAHVEYLDKPGFAPIALQGPVSQTHSTIDGQDSQYVSARLCAACIRQETLPISVINMHEKPWIELSLQWLQHCGLAGQLKDDTVHIKPQTPSIEPKITIPPDWSSCAFVIGAHLLTLSPGRICNLEWPSTQGDSTIARWLLHEKLGHFEDTDLVITPHRFSGSTLNMDTWIDALPIMSIILTKATSPSTLCNFPSSYAKECNRPQAISNLLQQMQIRHTLQENLTIWPGQIQAQALTPADDHRMVLSAICASLTSTQACSIENIAAIDKTYPQFLKELIIRGVQVS